MVDMNLDLAQAARRAGWNVLTVHPRGAWGYEGDYSIGNTVADSGAAMAFLRDPSDAEKYSVDLKKLAIFSLGHSVGG